MLLNPVLVPYQFLDEDIPVPGPVPELTDLFGWNKARCQQPRPKKCCNPMRILNICFFARNVFHVMGIGHDNIDLFLTLFIKNRLEYIVYREPVNTGALHRNITAPILNHPHFEFIKPMQQCGFKLSTIITDIFGMSGMDLINMLCKKGSLTPEDVESCLHGTLRNKYAEVRLAVAGKLSEHDRIFLTNLVKVMNGCQEEITTVEEHITAESQKYEASLCLLETIPALQRRAATIIISELGTDLSMFPSARHLCKWAGLCPGDNESAKKKKSSRITHGNPRIKSVMTQCAWAATRCKNFFLRDWFYRLRTRRGTKKALIAVARKLLSIVWHILTTGEVYDESRYEVTKKNQEERRRQKLKSEAAKLGYKLIPA